MPDTSSAALRRLVSEFIGVRPDPESDQPPGPWDPVIRRAFTRVADVFGPHPDPWTGEPGVPRRRGELVALNPQPLPPKALFAVTLAEEVVDHVSRLQDIADSTGQSDSSAIDLVSRFAEDMEICPPWRKWPFPPPKLGDTLLDPVDLVTVGVAFEQLAMTVPSETLREEIRAAGERLIEAGATRIGPERSEQLSTGGTMGSSHAPIHLGRSSLGKNRHVCAFFNSEEEELEVLTAFLAEGLNNGERAVHIHASPRQLQGLKALESAGVDVAKAFDTGQLTYASPGRAYLNDGDFDQDKVLGLIRTTLEAGRAMGSPRTRLVGHANALFRQFVGSDTWIEYEARLNERLIGFDDPVICAYDLSTMTGEMMLAILSTHPVVFADGRLRPNPFFVTPLMVVAEIENRRRGIPPAAHSHTGK